MENYKSDLHSFVKFKIIWARKSDKIKNQIDYDFKILESRRKEETATKPNISNLEKATFDKKKINPTLFEKQNKFEKYQSLKTELKNNRKL